MKNFISRFRTVESKEMTLKEYNDLRGWELPANENGEDPGYLVVNTSSNERNVDGFDGYVSWLPKAAFEQEYRSSNFTFGQAVELLKEGNRVSRSGWNGKGMFLLLIKGETVTEKINDCYGDPNRYDVGANGYEKGESIPVLDAIYMKTADKKLVPWLASQTDILSEDWVLA